MNLAGSLGAVVRVGACMWQRGVSWRKGANVQAMPTVGSRLTGWPASLRRGSRPTPAQGVCCVDTAPTPPNNPAVPTSHSPPPPQVVEVAAPTGQGLPELEEALLLQSEMMELQARL